tara:strand:- start:1134 stop:1346 length:213 start_codon:yes stop_codon:yes gene_type:complete
MLSRVDDTGLERFHVTDCAASRLRQSEIPGAAKCAAVDSDYLRMLNAWPQLPREVKAGITAIIAALEGGD